MELTVNGVNKTFVGVPDFNQVKITSGASFIAGGRFPIESWKIWENADDAKAFLMYTGNDATAYVGMILVVLGDGVYVVNKVGADAGTTSFDETSWTKLGSDSNVTKLQELVNEIIGDGSDSDNLTEEVFQSLTEIWQAIEDDEKVTAAALNDLNSRLTDAEGNALTVSKLEASGNNRESYEFKSGETVVATIDIPYDRTLLSAEYVNVYDSSDDDYDSEGDYDYLKLVYALADGTESEVHIPLNSVLYETEVQGIINKFSNKTVNGDNKLVTVSDIKTGDYTTTVSVGNLPAGSSISNLDYESLTSLVKSILCKEEWNDTFVLPTLNSASLNGKVDGADGDKLGSIYEVGTQITNIVGKVSTTDGKYGTYSGVNKTTVNASGSTGNLWKSVVDVIFNTATLNTDDEIIIASGNNVFTVTSYYNAGQDNVVVQSNLGTKSTAGERGLSAKILAGSKSINIIIKGMYKVWYGEADYDSIASTATNDIIVAKLGSTKWISATGGDDVSIGNITVSSDKSYYFYVPSTYSVKGTSLAKDDSSAVQLNTSAISHSLSNGDTVDYNLYYYKVSGSKYSSVHIC